jgi:DNA-binding beta-propeller fold protein YncE
MKFALLVIVGLCVAISLGCHANTATEEPLRLVQKIALPGVNGRIDHLAVDLTRQRLFIAALGNNTVEVVDLKQGKRIRSLDGFHEPQGVAFDPEDDLLLIANGGSGRCDFVDASSFGRVGEVNVGGDADNVRWDQKHHVFVVGYGDGGLATLDPKQRKVLQRVALAGHPESFQIDPTASRIFVNIPDQSQITVVNSEGHTIVATWPETQARANFPMALDAANHRLFIGCRNPSRLLVLDTSTGKSVAQVKIDGDTDDVFYDAAKKRLYVTCGAGFLDIIQQSDKDHYQTVTHSATAAGARTSLFVPELGQIFLAVPHRGGENAEIRIYSVTP